MVEQAYKLLVIIPALNEAGTISAVVGECLEYSRDVVVVDDGSADGTGDLALAAGAKIIKRQSNGGLGAALVAGFKYALEKGFDLVVTVDGDGAHDPAWIPGLVAHHLNTKSDITIGSRFKGGAHAVPSSKIAANFFATSLTNRILAGELTDAASGMRLLGRRVMSRTFDRMDFGFAYELLYEAKRESLRIEEYPVQVRYDGRELFGTQQGELLNLLAFAFAIADDLALRENLLWLRSMVESYSLARIQVGGRFLVMLPIRECGMYSFQEQSRWFVDLERDAEEWRTI